MELVVTRNSGLTADEKVNELVEGLWVAVAIVIALLTLSLGWREAIIVAVAVPVVFGLTLGVNLLFGYTINRVTLFALILSLGLLVDDPIVDVENIARHFAMRGRATRDIVLEAVAEIRPPLISATLAVIVSFLPMFFITGMMGPYMAPMALNVPVAMMMSMVVAFTITPWLTYQLLHRKYATGGGHAWPRTLRRGRRRGDPEHVPLPAVPPADGPAHQLAGGGDLVLAGDRRLDVRRDRPGGDAAVPLKMLPYDNKNELLLVIDGDEGTTLERTDALVRAVEAELAGVPEVTDFVSYVGLSGPIDFNGLVRHYYLRQMPHSAEVRVNFVGKKHRATQSHGIALRLQDSLTALAERHRARLKVVELPPGPPVLASLVAEVYGRADHSYDDLIASAATVARRLAAEPGVVDVDDTVEAPMKKLVFITDQEKAALNGVSVDEIAQTLRLVLAGGEAGTVRLAGERNPLRVELRLPRPIRSDQHDLAAIRVRGRSGQFTPALRAGPMGSRPRGSDGLSQEPRAGRVRDRRDAGPDAGRVRRGHDGRPGPRRLLRAGVGRRGPARRLGGRGEAASARRADVPAQRRRDAVVGARRHPRRVSAARGSGRSRSTSSATSASPSAPRW